MNLKDRLRGCLIGGTIGDCICGKCEGSDYNDTIDYNFDWSISDDTQLTLATCEAIYNKNKINPELVAAKFLEWFNKRKLTELGSSTLKALSELQIGGHWALVGRSGEYLLFKSSSQWTASQAQRAEILFEKYPLVKQAYELAMKLGYIFEKTFDKGIAFTRLARWYNDVEKLALESFQVVSRSIQAHYLTILNFFNNRSTNAGSL